MTTIFGSALHFTIGTLSVGVPYFFEMPAWQFYAFEIAGAVNLVASMVVTNVWPALPRDLL